MLKTALCIAVCLLGATGGARQVHAADSGTDNHSGTTMITERSWKEFEALKPLSGQAYVEARDHLLRSPDIHARLRPYLASSDWAEYFQAVIIAGWLRNEDLYRGVLSELDSAELEKRVDGLRPTAVNLAPINTAYAFKAKTQYGESISSLCWEAVLKSTAAKDWQSDVFVHMLYAVPSTKDLGATVSLLMDTTDPRLKDIAATYLSWMPAKAVTPPLEKEIAVLEAKIDQSDDYRRLVDQQETLTRVLLTVKERAQ